MQSDSLEQRIVAQTEEEFTAQAHFGLGLWMRNQWGLWRGGPLTKYFCQLGVYHPDDMSSIILTTYLPDLTPAGLATRPTGPTMPSLLASGGRAPAAVAKRPGLSGQLTGTAGLSRTGPQSPATRNGKTSVATGGRLRAYIDYQCGLLALGKRTLLEGEVVQWMG